ncbi:MAG: hypothetical protein Q8M76_07445 [Spirochaetaceae bacterium]|nr:hypothetical protein [Spirochaetaceae bacterium]
MARVDLEAVNRAFSACTWGNTNDTPQDWLETLEGDDEDAKRRLFFRIFTESPESDSLRTLFDRESIARFAQALNKPLRRSFAERRRKVWRYLYCGIREPIPELDWIIHDRADHA